MNNFLYLAHAGHKHMEESRTMSSTDTLLILGGAVVLVTVVVTAFTLYGKRHKSNAEVTTNDKSTK